MISLKYSLKDAYADIPIGRGSGQVKGIVYKITFMDYLFTEELRIYDTLIFDYITERMGFGFAVKYDFWSDIKDGFS